MEVLILRSDWNAFCNGKRIYGIKGNNEDGFMKRILICKDEILGEFERNGREMVWIEKHY